jgi:hypothetical protein
MDAIRTREVVEVFFWPVYSTHSPFGLNVLTKVSCHHDVDSQSLLSAQINFFVLQSRL